MLSCCTRQVGTLGSVSAAIEATLLADEAGLSVVVDGLDAQPDFHTNFAVGPPSHAQTASGSIASSLISLPPEEALTAPN